MNYTTTIPFSLLTDSGEQGLNLSFLGTWTDVANRFPIQGDEINFNECAGAYGNTCGEPTPEFKWTSRASFIDGPLTTSIRWRHLSGVDDDDGVGQVDAYDLIDLTFAVDVSERFTVNAGVTNLFDTLPSTPTFDANGVVNNNAQLNSLLLGDSQEQANTFPSTYDVLGRRYFVSASFKF